MMREKKFIFALPRPPAALAIRTKVFSRRMVGGITSILRRFEVCASASFCCDSIQYSLYIARATDIMSHSLFAHATSSYSIVLLGTDGEKSSDCFP